MLSARFHVCRQDVQILMYALRKMELERDLPDDMIGRAHDLFLQFHLMDMLAPFNVSVDDDVDE